MHIKDKELNDTIEAMLDLFGGADGGASFLILKDLLEQSTAEQTKRLTESLRPFAKLIKHCKEIT